MRSMSAKSDGCGDLLLYWSDVYGDLDEHFNDFQEGKALQKIIFI